MASNIYITSDLHLSHFNLIHKFHYRTDIASTIEEHDEAIIKNWNNIVSNNDIGIVLGDFIMGDKTKTIPKYLPRFNKKKLILIKGNHDTLNSDRDYLYLDNGINKIYSGIQKLSNVLSDIDEQYDLKNYNINLCHYPYRIELFRHDKEFYNFPNEENNVLLFGHLHSNIRIYSKNMIHIGMDAWNCKPINLKIILDMFENNNENI